MYTVSSLLFFKLHGPPLKSWNPTRYTKTWLRKHRSATDTQTLVAVSQDKTKDPLWVFFWRVCRPKLFKNLCLSLVSGVTPLIFRTTPLVHGEMSYTPGKGEMSEAFNFGKGMSGETVMGVCPEGICPGGNVLHPRKGEYVLGFQFREGNVRRNCSGGHVWGKCPTPVRAVGSMEYCNQARNRDGAKGGSWLVGESPTGRAEQLVHYISKILV